MFLKKNNISKKQKTKRSIIAITIWMLNTNKVKINFVSK